MSRPVIPVLMSGGRGTRLWPLSRRALPKQLQPLLGSSTMMQATAVRMRGVPGADDPMVVCSRDHVGDITRQLESVGCPPALIVAEPVGRNTAPAVAAASILAPPDSVLVILPADHVVADVAAFRQAMEVAVTAADQGRIVTFGVVPDRAETGYGYIEAEGEGNVRPIVDFVEKPDADTAATLLSGGRHFWNSGMFVFRPGVVLEEMVRLTPGIVDTVRRSLAGASGKVVEPGPEFEHALSLPFDVAVMEKTNLGAMVPLDAGWDDVGSWRSLWEVSPRTRDENAVSGDVLLTDVHRSLVRAGDRPVVVLGLDDAVVVDAGDVVFVASMERAQDVRDLVAQLEERRPDLV